MQHAAELVHASSRCACRFCVVKQLVEVRRADRGQRQRTDGFRDHILPESLALATPARLRAAMVEPPGAQVRERSGQVLRPRRKAVAGAPREVAMTASLDLELVG